MISGQNTPGVCQTESLEQKDGVSKEIASSHERESRAHARTHKQFIYMTEKRSARLTLSKDIAVHATVTF